MAHRCFHALLLCGVVILASACKEEGGIKVSSFTFKGNEAVTDKQLRSVLATQPSSRLPWGEKHYFSREQFEADLKRIAAFYVDRGFPDARVTDFDVELSEDQSSVRIALEISEGEPIRVERMVFEGFDTLPEGPRTRLEDALPLKVGQPIDRALLQASREVALDNLREFGHPYASVRLSETNGSSERQRVVSLVADPGPQARHGDIEISGNSSVDDNVVRRHLTFRPGMLYRQSRLQESQRRLYGLELFQFANVEPLRLEEQSVVVPTRVTVTEGKHRRVNFGVGYGTEEKARAEVDWRHVNFFGGARTAGVHARYSGLDGGVRVNFNQPWLFSPRYSLGFTAQAWHTSEPVYDQNTRGARVTVTREFRQRGRRGFRSGPTTTLSLSYANDSDDYTISPEALRDPELREQFIARGLDPETGKGRGQRSAFILDAGRNTTDNLLDARRGYVAALHLENARPFLGGTFEYFEVTGEGRYYQSIADRLVLAVQARAGSIAASGDDPLNVPFFKRYFLGGATNLRGWGRFQVAPLTDEGAPIGGHTFLNFSTEARFPIWRALGGVIFLDAGNVWADKWDFNVGDLRYNVGPGLRYNTPIGPIRADLGYQLNPIEALRIKGREQPRRFRFHFSIGQAF